MEFFRRDYQAVASGGGGGGSARHSSGQTGEHIHRRGTGTLGQGPLPRDVLRVYVFMCWGFCDDLYRLASDTFV